MKHFRPLRYRIVFAIAVKKGAVWRDLGGRKTYMSACEEAEKLRGANPREYRVLHQKLLDKKGEYHENS